MTQRKIFILAIGAVTGGLVGFGAYKLIGCIGGS